MTKHQLNPDTWINLYADQLLSYALVRVPERDVAKDLVQDTFFSALKSKENFRGEISEKNWLYLILRSRILDYYKKRKEVLESDFGTDDDDDDSFDNKGHWMDGKLPKEWSTDNIIQNKEFMQIFIQCKSALKEVQAQVFTMKYIDGEESETICKELEISSSNYWVLIHRAKLQLRSCIEKNWFDK